jgi:hypothetical protein
MNKKSGFFVLMQASIHSIHSIPARPLLIMQTLAFLTKRHHLLAPSNISCPPQSSEQESTRPLFLCQTLPAEYERLENDMIQNRNGEDRKCNMPQENARQNSPFDGRIPADKQEE